MRGISESVDIRVFFLFLSLKATNLIASGATEAFNANGFPDAESVELMTLIIARFQRADGFWQFTSGVIALRRTLPDAIKCVAFSDQD